MRSVFNSNKTWKYLSVRQRFLMNDLIWCEFDEFVGTNAVICSWTCTNCTCKNKHTLTHTDTQIIQIIEILEIIEIMEIIEIIEIYNNKTKIDSYENCLEMYFEINQNQ